MKKDKTVMVFGTFDLVHKGHHNFFNQAKKLGDSLIISVARDVNVKKIKGFKPWNSEEKRLAALKKLKIAGAVILGDTRGYIKHIKKVAPDIIALGYDQSAYTKTLRKDLERAGLKTKVIRLKPHRPNIYKTSKLKMKMLKSK